jgi:alkylation response protein AidB-like acyl-CoA dehydrogenase
LGGRCVVDGEVGPVLGAVQADALLLAARLDGEEVWFAAPRQSAGLEVTPLRSVDLTRGVGAVVARELVVSPIVGLAGGRVRALAAVWLAAEACGIARWCLDTALAYVKVREQFGRPVGSFQAVKHRCASMFVRLETMCAAAWDAALAVQEGGEQLDIASAGAALTCLPVARELALDSVTLLGGIGYTWEHDVHLYERRALSISQLLSPARDWSRRLGELTTRTVRRLRVQPLEDHPVFRRDVALALEGVALLPAPDRRCRLAELGFVAPHYALPYGLGASPVQQLILAEELERARIAPPALGIGGWALPPIIEHGTDAQRERFVMPTLRGDLDWCQLYSEPGAGSDLAAVGTRAEKVDGGWRLNGQKVWTSNAHRADWGFCLARSDPRVPKHRGISYFLLDMSSEGVMVRPLRQATGAAEFNEVFLTDVFVADECLLGAPGDGWPIARQALAIERLTIGRGGMQGGSDVERLRDLLPERVSGRPFEDDLAEFGELVAEQYTIEALSAREAALRLRGEASAGGSVLKVAGALRDRRRATVVLGWRGAAAAALEGAAGDATLAYLRLPSTLIGGGTLEVQLNVIAERILGLPR